MDTKLHKEEIVLNVMNNAPLKERVRPLVFVTEKMLMFLKVHKSSSIAGTVWDDRIITEGTLDTEDFFDPVKIRSNNEVRRRVTCQCFIIKSL